MVRPNHETLSSNMTQHVNLHRKRDFAGGGKFANQLILKERDCPGLFRWAPWNHRVLRRRERGRRECQSNRIVQNNCQRDEHLLALKTDEGVMGLKSKKGEENRFCAKISRKEGSPPDLGFSPSRPCWTWDLQNSKRVSPRYFQQLSLWNLWNWQQEIMRGGQTPLSPTNCHSDFSEMSIL